MVSYFYEANYDCMKYDTPQPLLHAQTAIISDKYDCPSLLKVANARFSDSLGHIKEDEWSTLARFVYNHTMTGYPAHAELQSSVVEAFMGLHSLSTSALYDQSTVDLLRTNADLATDLLLNLTGPKTRDLSVRVLVCDMCHYVHVGRSDCPRIVRAESSADFLNQSPSCPSCGQHSPLGKRNKAALEVRLHQTVQCPGCDGVHSLTDSGVESNGLNFD